MAQRRCAVGVPVKGAFEYWSRGGGTELAWISETAQDLGRQRGGVKTFQVRGRTGEKAGGKNELGRGP